MRKISESTTLPISLILPLLGTLTLGVIAGSFWVAGVEHELQDIKKSVARIQRILEPTVTAQD